MAEVKTGASTSEFKLSAVIALAGAALDVAGILLGSLRESGLVAGGWLPATLVVVGALVMVAQGLGYSRSRTLVKLAELQPRTTEAIKLTVPLAKELALAIREELSKPALSQLPSSQSTPPVAK
jgi:hypothetical protein